MGIEIRLSGVESGLLSMTSVRPVVRWCLFGMEFGCSLFSTLRMISFGIL